MLSKSGPCCPHRRTGKETLMLPQAPTGRRGCRRSTTRPARSRLPASCAARRRARARCATAAPACACASRAARRARRQSRPCRRQQSPEGRGREAVEEGWCGVWCVVCVWGGGGVGDGGVGRQGRAWAGAGSGEQASRRQPSAPMRHRFIGLCSPDAAAEPPAAPLLCPPLSLCRPPLRPTG